MLKKQYNLLFRWFVGLSMDDPIWDATVFTKNRDRLLEDTPTDSPDDSGNPTVNFRGEARKNDTRQSTTDQCAWRFQG
jgi:hypothetical protein